MSNKLIINKIPSSKTEQKEMANAFISKVIDGDINPIDAVVHGKTGSYCPLKSKLKNPPSAN